MREVIQHIDDIEIPVIKITDGWPAENCKTIAECDDAFAYLMSACAGIEYQIDMERTKPLEHQNRPWLAKANCALKYKKAALAIVNQRRANINAATNQAFKEQRDQKLLRYIRSVVPDRQFLDWVQASGAIEHVTQTEAA